jgi:hypothetical protein
MPDIILNPKEYSKNRLAVTWLYQAYRTALVSITMQKRGKITENIQQQKGRVNNSKKRI